MGRVKIVHLTSAHLYNDTRIFAHECRSLANHGYDVVLVAPAADGMGDVIDGVRFKQIRKYRGRAQRATKTVVDAYRSAMEEDAAVYHLHDPELLPIALLLHAQGKRVVYDAHENVAEQIRSSLWIPRGFRSLAAYTFERLERFGARRFAAVIAANSDIYEHFKEYRNDVVELNNYPIPSELGGYLPPDRPRTENLVVDFGGMSPHTLPGAIVQAMGRIAPKLQARLVLGGRVFSEELLKHCSTLPGWNRVHHTGRVRRAEMMRYLKRASISVVLYSREPNHFGIGSNRFFESLAAGLPVVTPDFPNWRKIVEKIGCGIPVAPENPGQIADAITYLFTHPNEATQMGNRGQEAIMNGFNWCKEELKLLQLYQRLVADSRAAAVKGERSS